MLFQNWDPFGLNLHKYSLGERGKSIVIMKCCLSSHVTFFALLEKATHLKMDEKSFIRADIRGKDKCASNDMGKCEGEGKRGCALVFGPLRLFMLLCFYIYYLMQNFL